MSKKAALLAVFSGLLATISMSSQVMADGPAGEESLESQPRASLSTADSSKTGSSRKSRLENVNDEEMAAAVGHYARARSLLIAALNEFDSGMKIANPDSILDSRNFRSGLIDRAEELERILDPQPRATKGGVKYSADPRLLGTKK